MSPPRDYTWRATQDGRVFVSHRGRQIKVLTGAPAARLVARLTGATDDEVQLELARVTGNFKRGNERR
jgi:hypothetical protein